MAIVGDLEFPNIQMAGIWKLVEACIIPIITYASETWEPNKTEMKKLNQCLEKIIKRILMTPQATPREALYIETGLLDIETIIDKKRLNMKARLNREKSELMAEVLNYPGCKWVKKTNETMAKYSISEEDLMLPYDEAKRVISEKTREVFYEKIIKKNLQRANQK